MITLVTGAAASGKSAVAEQLALGSASPRCYLAAMRPSGSDDLRVARHRAMRAGKGFVTVECADGFALALREVPAGATVLLEDLGCVVANELFAVDGTMCDVEQAYRSITRDLEALACVAGHLVVVGCEVGCDGVVYADSVEVYRRLLGRVACEVAARADMVLLCSCGIPQVVKGVPV